MSDSSSGRVHEIVQLASGASEPKWENITWNGRDARYFVESKDGVLLWRDLKNIKLLNFFQGKQQI